MARIRSIKPEFWVDRSFVRKVPNRDARMLYMALWNLADEHARLMGDPAYVKGQAFPYAEDDDLTPKVIDALLDTLADAGRVVRYEVDGDPYLFLPRLAKHQRLEAAKVPSRLPPPPDPDDPAPRPDKSARDADKTARGADTGAPAVNVQASTAPESRADLSARRADECAPGADESALLYVAGCMEQVAGGRDCAAPDALFDEPAPAVPASAAADKPRGKPKPKAKPKQVDPELDARNKLAVELTRQWWDTCDPKPSGQFVGRQQIVRGLLEAGHSTDDITEALRRCGFSMTRASAELHLKRLTEERERSSANILPFQRRDNDLGGDAHMERFLARQAARRAQ